MQEKDKLNEADDISIEIIDVDEDEGAGTPVKSKSELRKEAEEADFKQTLDVAWSALETQVEQLKSENASLKDQLLRKQAEFENYRKRTDREKREARQSGRKAVLIDMLSVLDNFERALTVVSKGPEDDALRQGLELIYKQFKDTLAKLGVEPVEAVGKTFDPHLHEAVTIEESSTHEANTVMEEFQKGYRLGDQLLRPAQVKVAASPTG
jgi:molecular chaperone GrpE